MGQTMGQRRAGKAEKGRILDELCVTAGWHRGHARKALSGALKPKVVRTRSPRSVELVAALRHFGEFDISDAVAAALLMMSAATMDRRLAPDRAVTSLRGRSHTKPGSLLEKAIAIRTWAQWDDAVQGFVEIDLVGTRAATRSGTTPTR